MHELAIAQNVLDSVLDRMPDAAVVEVRLTVGKLSGISADALRFCFELVTSDTVLEGARLSIDEPAGAAHCETCGCEFRLEHLIPLCACGSANVRIVSGDQLLINSVKVA